MPTLTNVAWLNQDLTQKMMRPTELSNHATIGDFLSAQGLNVSPEQIDELKAHLEQELNEYINECAAYSYQMMELENDYGECGEQRVSISYCRHLLKIPHNRPVTQFDADIFRRKIEEERGHLGLKGRSLKDLKAEYYQKLPTINGVKFTTLDNVAESVNEILRKLGSKKRIAAGFYGLVASMIFGDAIERRCDDFWVCFLEKEEARTPNNVLSIAAMIGKKYIWLRLEACRTIFYNKWVKIYRYDQREKQLLLSDPYSNISEAIKQHCANLYGGTDETSLIAIENTFVNEMAEIIVQHEMGHNVSQLNGKYLDYYAIGEGVRRYGENILTLIKEFLADWVVQSSQWKEKGAIKTCIDMALVDRKPKEATRLLLMYVSDSWFYDTGETYMFLHSDIMMVILVNYINPNSSFDFERLNHDIWSEADETSRLASIYGFVENTYFNISQKIDEMISLASYVLPGDHVVNFKGLLNEVYVDLREEAAKNGDVISDVNDLSFRNNLWTKIFTFIASFNPELEQKIKTFLTKAGEEAIRAIFAHAAGEKIAESYGYDHRKFIVDKMKEGGYWIEPKPLKITDSLKLVMEDLFFSKNEQKEAAKEFMMILKGKPKTLRLSNEGEPSPFCEVLQEMIRKQKDQSLDQPVVISHKAEGSVGAEVLEQKLDQLMDQVNKKLFSEVRILRVKKGILPLPELENLLKGKVCADGDSLLDKVWHLDESELSEDKLLEFYLPTKIGYPCLNTIRSIKKLNSQIGVKDSDKKSETVVDKKLIESLSKEYLSSSF